MVDPRLPLDHVVRRLTSAGLLEEVHGPGDVTLTGVAQDSRMVGPGYLFLCWKGLEFDAHDFLGQAVSAGASAAVVEEVQPQIGVTQLRVNNGRLAGALAADAVLGSPWEGLFLAATTGTNGKTTTAVLSRHLLQAKGSAWAVGTLGLVEESGNVRPGTEGLTTPGPVQLSTWMREMADEGIGLTSLEASSHALVQHRLDGQRFDVGVFTTLGRDHLDYHADFQEYRDAKGRLLELLKPSGWAVVRRDEPGWAHLPLPRGRTATFGIGEPVPHQTGKSLQDAVQLTALELELLPGGSVFRLSDGEAWARVELPFLGRFNVENALAAAGIAQVAGLSLEEIAERLSNAPQVPGRLQRVASDPFTVLIDFAHTPDALEGVLSTLRPVVKGRLLVLFGAGGDRDKGKRPRMGAVVAGLADLAIVTSDNPRTEDPEAIIDDVVEAMGDVRHLRFANRRDAIEAALNEAAPGDLLLLAGKGHESYQVVGREKLPFDETAIVRELLGTRGGEVEA